MAQDFLLSFFNCRKLRPFPTSKVGIVFLHFWNDEKGFVNASNYILLVTIIAIGAVAGLTSIRDSVVQELGDLGLALENVDQSYTVNCTIGTMVKQFGFNDTDGADDDVAGEPPGCIEICLAANSEGVTGGGGGGGPLEATPE